MINMCKHPEMDVFYLVDTNSLRVLSYWHDHCLDSTWLDPLVRKNLIVIEENCQRKPAHHFDEYFETRGFCQVDM